MSGGAHGTPASGRANRRRGADAERQVVNYLREHGYPDARRYLAGDSRQPGDIDAIPGVSMAHPRGSGVRGMRHLSAALVVIAVMVPMVLGDMGLIPDPADQRSYDIVASIALGAFALLIIVDRGRLS